MTNATIYDVAGAAKVSLATVSRVLNSPEKVKQETRDRVLKVIEELGYRPNAIARGLASRHTTTIGIIVSDITRASVSEMIGGIMDLSKEYEYSVKIFSMHDEKNIEDFGRKVVSEQLDGIILLNDEINSKDFVQLEDILKSADVPLVLANCTYADSELASVNIDFAAASYEITKQMISKGRKNIYLFSTVRPYTVNMLKEEGYAKAMEEAGLAPCIFRTSGDPDINQLHFTEFFKNHKIDGAIAVRDSIAVSFMNIAIENGRRIPEDILVVGFQNTRYARLARPQLTCIDMPVYEIGVESMRLLTKYMKNEEVTEKNISIPYSLIYRASMTK